MPPPSCLSREAPGLPLAITPFAPNPSCVAIVAPADLVLETPIAAEVPGIQLLLSQHRRRESLREAFEQLLTMCRQPLLRHLAATVLMAEEADKKGTGHQMLEGLSARAPQTTPDGASLF